MALRKIRLTGDEILRKKSRIVEKVDGKIRELIDDMVETMHEFNGVGLAAPQVGILKRIIVIDLYDGSPVLKLINPEIKSEEEKQEVEEGCLSFPNQYAKVVRPKKITVTALDENGNEITIEAEDLLAQALSHEIDHLNGILFVDKMLPDTLEYIEQEE